MADKEEVRDHFEETLISTILTLIATGLTETEVRRICEMALNKARHG